MKIGRPALAGGVGGFGVNAACQAASECCQSMDAPAIIQ